MAGRLFRAVNFANNARLDIGDKVGEARGFFPEVKRVWDEPDWRKRARENERRGR